MEVNRLIGLKRKVRKQGWNLDFSVQDEHAMLYHGCYFDEHRATDPILYIENKCKQSKGEWGGQLVELLDWQIDGFFYPVFGWLRPNGFRRYRKFSEWVAKKNGKSTKNAGLACYLADPDGDGERGAEVYLAANDKDQAGIIFKETGNMIASSPELTKTFKVNWSTRNINYGTTSWIRALAADAASNEGWNTHVLMIDEFHSWPNYLRPFYEALVYSMIARKQPLTLITSTAGDNEESLGYEEYQYAKRVIAGEIIDPFYGALIYEASKDDDMDEPETWAKANPSLGFILSETEFKESLEEAKRKGPRALAVFKRYRLNIWCSTAAPYLDMHQWALCGEEVFDEDIFIEAERVSVGLDLASKEDLVSACFSCEKDGKYYFKWLHWCPEETIQNKFKEGDNKYNQWVDEGYLYEVPGARISQIEVFEQVIAHMKKYDAELVRIDPWNADWLLEKFEEYNLEAVVFNQTSRWYSIPTKELHSLVGDNKIRHNNNPVATFMAGNLTVKEDSFERIVPIKRDSKRRYKIDAMTAAIMSLDGLMRLKEERSAYEDGSVLEEITGKAKGEQAK